MTEFYKHTIRTTEDLIPYAGNSRTHSPEQISQIAASIREWGFTNPVLIDEEDTVVAGHGRLRAAEKLGYKSVPCIVLEGLSEAQRRAYVIADNRLALNAGWDEDMLAAQLTELGANEFDLELLGFEATELDELLEPKREDGADPDETPEPNKVAYSSPGDVWTLGRHRLVCGDCTDPETVALCLGDVVPHLMVTDPPYGVEYNPAWRAEAGKQVDADKLGRVSNDDRADWREAYDLFPGDVAYVWHASLFSAAFATSLEAAGFTLRSQIIWAKDCFALSRGDYHWQHEPCWYAVREGARSNWNGDRSQSSIWNISARGDTGLGHGTQKPVEAMRRPIANNSSRGQAVYDPFVGAGTTIIACEELGRQCFAIELDPVYIDVAIKRWQDYSGGVATNQDGLTFAEIMGVGDADGTQTNADAD